MSKNGHAGGRDESGRRFASGDLGGQLGDQVAHQTDKKSGQVQLGHQGGEYPAAADEAVQQFVVHTDGGHQTGDAGAQAKNREDQEREPQAVVAQLQ